MERNYLNEVQKGFKTKKRIIVERAIQDLIREYEERPEQFNSMNISEIEQQRRGIILELYYNLNDYNKLLSKSSLPYVTLNNWLSELIFFNSWQLLFFNLGDEFDIVFNVNKDKSPVSSDLIDLIYTLKESYFYEIISANNVNKLIPYRILEKIENKIEKDVNTISAIFTRAVNLYSNDSNSLKKLNLADKFIGNPIEKRHGNTFEKYKQTIACYKCIEKNFRGISGIQKKACEIFEINPNTFSQWKLRNGNKFWSIYNSLTEKEVNIWKDEIRKRFLLD